MDAFTCDKCKKETPANSEQTGGTGYGVNKAGEKVCYACCAVQDKAEMLETGKACLYLTNGKVSNWPETLSFPVLHSRKGRHNMAGSREDVYFIMEESRWHGVCYGQNTQLCHCSKLKAKV